eukprot:CAMPEP_0113298246 /NCGR_PEP_ID=MMETSP0010_2-20120614/772_1 /TAXON_ID=216773 ORGANISM="Corethron hystrix, Strain 308" /NCGR_SAMPLE_ID=MMETSP0010_2 /ASSEMBLY_ACC=CAM_ASM_000155 /LENGTH=318 /DNA_ID=CAMNT_0000151271 /DNA_START=144 /DNA_END=1100 /DNA_ORIENTATION=+ /assembly_acc=CAM_ASM_000155
MPNDSKRVGYFSTVLIIILLALPVSCSSLSSTKECHSLRMSMRSDQRPIDVIIVGGSSGMGKALAKIVVGGGGNALIASRDSTKLDRAAIEIRESFTHGNVGTVATAVVDIVDETSVETFSSDLSSGKYLGLKEWDGLAVTAAARSPHGPMQDLQTSAARSFFDSKFWGAYHCAKYLSPLLRHGGAIVFTAGILNRRPGINCSSLAITNGALEGLTRSLALELGPTQGIRVNCMSPGFCDTERFDHMDLEKREAMLRNTAASLPLRYVGSPEDMGESLHYLLTSRFTTGTILDVDGGHGIRQYASSSDDPMRKKINNK